MSFTVIKIHTRSISISIIYKKRYFCNIRTFKIRSAGSTTSWAERDQNLIREAQNVCALVGAQMVHLIDHLHKEKQI